MTLKIITFNNKWFYWSQIKVKLCPCIIKHHAMEIYGSGSLTPCILDFGTR
jgi:hypothetical protein